MTRSPSRRRVAALAMVVLASTGLAAGCGGDDESTPAPATLSAADFRQQADAICTTSDAAIEALGEPTAAAEVPAFMKKGLAVQAEQIAKLKALAAPAELKADFDAALALLDQQQTAIQEIADKIDGADEAAIAAAISEAETRIDGLQEQATAKAKALGLTVCGDQDEGTGTAP